MKKDTAQPTPLAVLEAKLRTLLTANAGGVPLTRLPPLLPTAWRQHNAKLIDFLRRFPNTVVVTGSSGHEMARLAWPFLLQTLKADVVALLEKSPNQACDLDDLVVAYAKLKNNADLDKIAELSGRGYLEDLLEELGFFFTWDEDTATISTKKATVAVPQQQSTVGAVQTGTVPAAKANLSQPAPSPTITESATKKAVVIVADVQHCRDVVQNILSHDHPLALDCEGINLGDKNGSLCLVQIATWSGQCFLFDVTKSGHLLFTEGGLRQVLEDVHVLKVGHDLQADASALFAQHGVFLNHIFDTQVGHSLLTQQQNKVGLNPMLKLYAEGQNVLKEAVKRAWTKDRFYWTRRPLSEEMIRYASLDVAFLLDAYDCMAAALESRSLLERAIIDSRLRIDNRRSTATLGTSSSPLNKGAGEEREITKECRIVQEDEDLDVILEALPEHLRDAILADDRLHGLVELMLDLGKPLMARFSGPGLPRVAQIGADQAINGQDLEHFSHSVTKFDSENRHARISKTLHRISRLLNRSGGVVGFTVRVGKTISGLVGMVEDVLRQAAERKASILLLGAPGMGKTSVIREMARELAAEWSVMIIDTSNEIAGGGDIAHPAIGAARRMQVLRASEQHKCMIEAVQNHTPDIIVVDEIGTGEEAKACCTIARRGVMLVATAHGVTLRDVADNPSLNSVVGGIESVTLGDAAMRERGAKQKTVRESKGPSAFAVAIELRSRTEWVVHHDVRVNVGLMLNGEPVPVEVRKRMPDGRVVATTQILDEIQLEPQDPYLIDSSEEEEGWVSNV